MHQQYGPIIQISPYELHVNDPAFFDTLYRQEGRWDRYPWAWDAWGAEGPTIHTTDHDRHEACRQPLAPFFSKAKPYREDFDVAVLHTAQGAGSLWRVTKHVGYVLPMLYTLPFDWAMKISNDNTKTFFAHLKVNLISQKSISCFIKLTLIQNAMKDTKDIMATAVSPLPGEETQRTIFHEILDSSLPLHDKSFKRIFEDVSSVSGAGMETIGGTLRLIFFYVFSNTKVPQRLRAELDDATWSSTCTQD
ncbi:Trichodiene oxygenase [Cytospora mali]|uniref:Trichodiene oxygenase n=1 Tax=Cytospora mali TaxID=578113 RepID=A0A194VU61_CYTMA|nr:Trichodiene oxygenase [Valsa mali]